MAYIIYYYVDQVLPDLTAVSSIPNEKELVVLIQLELD
ncbi:hypothetical protein STND_1445 [Streptococcus thermophilus ND03]|nr:hypothetical protein STND_1445 [Streptococcus thermophilus ND03]AKB98116.1 hypothetical protein SMQ301_1496 [Streptococcus thermophilus]KPL37932.1 hypothetical protein ADU38_403 [Streptococcus thermophilus]